jgi:hypothetical protein
VSNFCEGQVVAEGLGGLGRCAERVEPGERWCAHHRPDEIVMSDGMAEPPRSDPYRWHANEAEKLARIGLYDLDKHNPKNASNSPLAERYLAAAQVHAMLAHAAATSEERPHPDGFVHRSDCPCICWPHGGLW